MSSAYSCRGLDHCHDDPDYDPYPNDDRGPFGRDLLPSTPRKNVRRRNVVPPNEQLRTVVGSNTRHAICNGSQPGTSSPRSIWLRHRGMELRVRREVEVADRF